MSPAEIALIKASHAKLLPVADHVAALFYARLFELDPSVRALFSGDMTEQGRKLIEAISAAVSALDDFEQVIPMLHQLGARHAGYGATEEHYAKVGAALLWALDRTLAPGFTPGSRLAWSNLYSLIANTMMEGARGTTIAA